MQDAVSATSTALLILLLACGDLIISVVSLEGCGQHSPLARQQHKLLHRRLQQLRAGEAARPQSPTAPPRPSSPGVPQTVGPQELRIGPVFQLSGISSREAQRIEKQLIPAAIKVLQRFIKVIRPAGPPRVAKAFYSDSQQGSCLVGKDSPQLTAAAKNNDLSLYITAASTGCLPGMIAVAVACEVDPATKRPFMGTLNICPSALTGLDTLPKDSEAYGYAVGRLVEVMVHEIIHVLGFGSNHYEDWRGPDGKLYGAKKVIVTQAGRPFLATPRVTKVARDFFGCPSLPGAPLENEGPAFSATSHFEYRLLQREMMSPARPIDRSRARLSAFTLAALEDSGWYKADYTHVEPLDWGRGAGCDFVLASCWDYMTKVPSQPYFCGKGTVNQTRCTAAASGWGVCRSSAFTDECLLVGKYSRDTSVAVRDDVAASSADGRAAACYSPPQLAALQQGGSKGNLLPLLGGSYSAQPSDICYNLIQQPKPDSGSKPGCVIPEDCARDAAKVQATKQAERVASEAGWSAQARRPLGSTPAAAAAFTLFEQDAKAAGGARTMSASSAADSSSAAACVSVSEGTSPSQQGSSGQKASDGKATPKRALLSHLSHSVSAGLAHLVQVGGSLPLAGGHSGVTADASEGAEASRVLLAAAGKDSTAATQGPQASSGTAAACTTSPVLCFRSTCDAAGQLLVEVQVGAAAAGSSSSSSSKSPVRFACPSGKTVDLAKAVPGRYLLGSLQCPSNQLVCETMGCGDCSPSGGSCSRGKCFCHMERFGAGCRQTLVPVL